MRLPSEHLGREGRERTRPGGPESTRNLWRGPEPRRGADEALAPGTLVGRFIVHRTLGAGAVGVVHAAHDPELDRTVALKILRPELAGDERAAARFTRAAKSLARLSHPNVIAVHDVGAAGGHIFLAMEYVHAGTFADWVATTDATWPEIVEVLVKAGRGLSAAHAAGLIHGDFKPANLLVGVDGRVIVTDFGLGLSALTGTDGTGAYMAPEQQQGRPADARADLFSFCVTLHEALFREHPFRQGASSARSGRGVPVWLRRAVQRGLSRRPEERPRSMERLLAALTREPARRQQRTQLGLAAAMMILIGGGLAYLARGAAR